MMRRFRAHSRRSLIHAFHAREIAAPEDRSHPLQRSPWLIAGFSLHTQHISTFMLHLPLRR